MQLWYPHVTLGLRALRAVSTAMLVVLAGPVGASTCQWLRQETEFVRYRSAMQELSLTIQGLPAKAMAKRRPVQLRVDAARGMVQVTSMYEGAGPYDTIEHMLWLPKGLTIDEAPASLTVTPTGHVTPTLFVITAPSHNTLFRLTTTEEGRVRLHEEPLT